jgi:hypothetical protein
MKKAITCSLKVGLTALLLSPIFSLISLYICIGVLYLVRPENWGFNASINFYDIAIITGISSFVLPFVVRRVDKSAPGVYNKHSQIMVSTLFFSVPLAFLYFFVFRKSANYSFGNILMMIIPSFLALMLCIRIYYHEPKIQVGQFEVE